MTSFTLLLLTFGLEVHSKKEIQTCSFSKTGQGWELRQGDTPFCLHH